MKKYIPQNPQARKGRKNAGTGMKKRSLRIQITAAVGIIVTLACIALTLNSIYSANRHYLEYINALSFPVPADLSPGSLSENFPDSDTPQNPPSSEEFANRDIPQSNPSMEELMNSGTMEEDTVTFADIMKSFSTQGIEVMLLIVFASLIFTWWAAGKLLRPLESLTSKIRTIDEEKLSQPVAIAEGTREVQQLSETFNGMLERLDESFQIQKRFAADAAHELKTPLAAMKTSLQVLQLDDRPSLEDYQEFVQDTEESLERLIRTVESLLTLARDSKELEQEPVSLKELSGKVLADLEQKARRNQVSLSLEGEEITVSGSSTLFYRVIYNLVDNGIKYNKKGGTVRLSIRRKNSYAQVTVSDSGIGIPSDSLEEIFHPFFRADPSRSQKIEGSGLGLAIVHSVMERCHGTVEAESILGEGTTMKLNFPL